MEYRYIAKHIEQNLRYCKHYITQGPPASARLYLSRARVLLHDNMGDLSRDNIDECIQLSEEIEQLEQDIGLYATPRD